MYLFCLNIISILWSFGDGIGILKKGYNIKPVDVIFGCSRTRNSIFLNWHFQLWAFTWWNEWRLKVPQKYLLRRTQRVGGRHGSQDTTRKHQRMWCRGVNCRFKRWGSVIAAFVVLPSPLCLTSTNFSFMSLLPFTILWCSYHYRMGGRIKNTLLL